MLWMRVILVLSVCVCCGTSAWSQDIPDELYQALEGWDGTPEELQALFDALPPEMQAEIEGQFPKWSYEGGLGLGGGYGLELQGDRSGGFFRMEASFGVTWAVAEYTLPVYYAIPDLAGPWAAGFKVMVATDNFNSVTGGATFHWAYEYIGWTPYVDVGGLFRWDAPRGAQGGAHLEVGYGSILVQGYVQAQYFFPGEGLLTIAGGIRIPWLVFELLGEL